MPKWWRAGHARQRPGSIAEAELLSHLAMLLQPQEPIKEVFRNFPVEKNEKWGKNLVSPDMAVYGALKLKEAALFLEYDGYYRHHTPAGRLADVRKSKALLMHAPAGSQVLRIAHAHRGLKFAGEMREIMVDSWRVGHDASLLRTICQIVEKLLTSVGHLLQPDLRASLQDLLVSPASNLRAAAAVEFTQQLLAEQSLRVNMSSVHDLLCMQLNLSSWHASQLKDELGNRGSALDAYNFEGKLAPITRWLQDLGLKNAEVAKVIASFPAVLGCSIEENLKPTVQWFQDLGLKKAEVAKVVARNPQVLGYSIEENLKPTVQWFQDLGLKKAEVAKVVARNPQVLAYSIEGNLKPTVQWFRDLGLKNAEVAKVIARFPAVLGYSIEENLKPTVQWFRDLGLKKAEVAKVVARNPQVLGCSIEENLKPTVQWFQDLGLKKAEVAKVIARSPAALGCSIEENLKPTVQWFQDLGLKNAEVAKVVARNPQVLGYSIEENLNPTVQLFQDLGLKKAEVAKVIARFPAVLGCSIKENLKPTVQWFRDLGLTKAEVAKVIARNPTVLGCSVEENLKPKLRWLAGLGFSHCQITSISAVNPQIFNLNITRNLSRKITLLRQFVPAGQAANVLTQHPTLFNYSYERWTHRFEVLNKRGELWKFASAMHLTDENFSRRFVGSQKRHPHVHVPLQAVVTCRVCR